MEDAFDLNLAGIGRDECAITLGRINASRREASGDGRTSNHNFLRARRGTLEVSGAEMVPGMPCRPLESPPKTEVEALLLCELRCICCSCHHNIIGILSTLFLWNLCSSAGSAFDWILGGRGGGGGRGVYQESFQEEDSLQI